MSIADPSKGFGAHKPIALAKASCKGQRASLRQYLCWCVAEARPVGRSKRFARCGEVGREEERGVLNDAIKILPACVAYMLLDIGL